MNVSRPFCLTHTSTPTFGKSSGLIYRIFRLTWAMRGTTTHPTTEPKTQITEYWSKKLFPIAILNWTRDRRKRIRECQRRRKHSFFQTAWQQAPASTRKSMTPSSNAPSRPLIIQERNRAFRRNRVKLFHDASRYVFFAIHFLATLEHFSCPRSEYIHFKRTIWGVHNDVTNVTPQAYVYPVWWINEFFAICRDCI